MAHHPVDVVLCVAVKGRAFGTYFADIFVILLAMGFLPGTHWITIIKTGTDEVILPTFQSIRGLKFPAPVSQDQGKYRSKGKRPDGMLNGVKHGFHMAGFFTVKEAEDSVHFRDSCVWGLFQKSLQILVGTPFVNGFIRGF